MRRWDKNLTSQSFDTQCARKLDSAFCGIKQKNPGLTRGQAGGATCKTRLENKLQRQLQDTWVVRSIRLKQPVAEAARVAG